MTQDFEDFALESWQVDEVNECLPITPETSSELLRVAPDAYSEQGVDLKAIWERLSYDSRKDIRDAAERR